MMYRNNFVACVKVNGRILRETNGTVTIPFGSEYSILLKNMNSVRTQVKITIDDTEATSGWLVLNANSNSELERFIMNGNLHQGNKFKFIERTGDIEQHRGIKAGDGLIRIEFRKEMLNPVYVWNTGFIANRRRSDNYGLRTNNFSYGRRFSDGGGLLTHTNTSSGILRGNQMSATMSSTTPVSSSEPSCFVAGGASACSAAPSEEPGITVPGSISNQQFQYVSDFQCEQSEVITLQLKGQINNQKVTQPIEVDRRISCTTCGKKNASDNQFCGKCGTALMLIA